MHKRLGVFIFVIFVLNKSLMENKDSKDLSSAQFAHRNGICLMKYFYSKEEYNKSKPIYYDFKNKGKIEVGRRFNEHIFALDCFPRKYKETPSKSNLNKMLSAISFNLGFLNKDMSNKILLSYVFRVLDNKYYMYGYSIDIEQFDKFISYGKNKELEEINLNTRIYMWHNNYFNLNRKIKSSIMAKDRFKETVTKNTEIIFDTVMDLLENYNDFISNKIISDITGIPQRSVSRYVKIYEDKISEYNISKYGTNNYNKYIYDVHKDNIKNTIMNMKYNKEKINISKIANKLKLHRNTVSNIVNKHNLK